MADHSSMKLGRREAVIDHRRVALSKVVFSSLPHAPATTDWTNGHPFWGVMRNDIEGDCVFAGGGHLIQFATLASSDSMITPTDDDIEKYYTDWAGFNPLAIDANGNNATDIGYIEADFVDRWMKLGFCGQKLLGFASPDPKNVEHIKQSIAFFGPLYIGAVLPISAQFQSVWEVVKNDGGIWGAHCMTIPKYNSIGPVFCTWGGLKQATWEWWLKYADEAWTLLLEVWENRFPSAGTETLLKMLQAIGE